MLEGDEPGFRVRFVGRRFQGARLPVSVLSDIEAFRDLLVAFAKSEWKERNRDRQRVPKGFDENLQLDLVTIEDGSAVPVLQFSQDAEDDRLPGFKDGREELLLDSYDRIVNLVSTVENNPEFRPTLTRDQIGAFKRFGSGLRRDERIDFIGRRAEGDTVISLDAHRRKILMNRIRETYETRYTGMGYLTAISADGKITLNTPDLGAITVDVGDRAVDEFDGSLLSDVTVDLTLELDAHDRVQHVREVHSVDLHEKLSIEEKEIVDRAFDRLGELSGLQPGWLDGTGARVSELAARQAKFLIQSRPLWFASAGIFPTPDGGIQIETQKSIADVTINISSEGSFSGFALFEDAESSDEEYDSLDAVMAAIEKYASDEGASFGA